MTTQHTTGPWRLSSGDETEIFSGAKPVARAHCGGLTSVKLPEAEANARLIAAAPDLLRVVQDLMSDIIDLSTVSGDEVSSCHYLYDSAKAAIDKATATP